MADGASAGENKLRMAPYLCGVCGKELKSRSGLSVHKRSHEGNAPYQCCGKRFFSRCDLLRHRCSKHGYRKALKCDKCGYTCAVNADLTAHKRRVHVQGEHVCDECQRKFATVSHLRDHMDQHSGTRRHVCVCGKPYRYSSGLAKHKKVCNALKQK